MSSETDRLAQAIALHSLPRRNCSSLDNDVFTVRMPQEHCVMRRLRCSGVVAMVLSTVGADRNSNDSDHDDGSDNSDEAGGTVTIQVLWIAVQTNCILCKYLANYNCIPVDQEIRQSPIVSHTSKIPPVYTHSYSKSWKTLSPVDLRHFLTNFQGTTTDMSYFKPVACPDCAWVKPRGTTK